MLLYSGALLPFPGPSLLPTNMRGVLLFSLLQSDQHLSSATQVRT